MAEGSSEIGCGEFFEHFNPLAETAVGAQFGDQMCHPMGEAVDRSVTDAVCHDARLPPTSVELTPNLGHRLDTEILLSTKSREIPPEAPCRCCFTAREPHRCSGFSMRYQEAAAIATVRGRAAQTVIPMFNNT